MISELLLNKLNEIQAAVANDNLVHVVISSSVDQSFGKGYIRLEIDVVVKEKTYSGYGFPTKDYESYAVWGRNDRFFQRTQDEVLIDFKGTMAQYYADATRVFETISMRYPTITIHSQICSFQMLGDMLRLKDYYQIQCIRIIDGYYEDSYYDNTLESEWYDNQFKECQRVVDAFKGDNYKFENKFKFSSDYWR